MDEPQIANDLINWGDSFFRVKDSVTLEVVRYDDHLGWHDMSSWEEAALEGPIADARRANDHLSAFGLADEINTIRLIEKMLNKSRILFIHPLVELENYAKNYQNDSTQPKLF